MRPNKALAAWRRGEQTLGGWLSLANVHSAETMANLGFDWLCIDLQHGLLDYQDLTVMLPAISTTDVTPLVRVPWNEPYEIMKVLDAGAYGVIVPMINNRAEAEQAVAACRYPPRGNRSFGPIRAARHGRLSYAEQANDEIACIAMIETAEGIERAEEIAPRRAWTGCTSALRIWPWPSACPQKGTATIRIRSPRWRKSRRPAASTASPSACTPPAKPSRGATWRWAFTSSPSARNSTSSPTTPPSA